MDTNIHVMFLLMEVMFVILLLNYSTWGLGSVQTCLFQGKKTAYDQDQKVMFSLLQATRNQYLPVILFLSFIKKLYYQFYFTVVKYENWTILDKIRIKLLKYLFKLPRSTMTAMVCGETGLYPISVLVQSRMARFWCSIISNSNVKYSAKLYTILYDLHVHNVHDTLLIG